MCFTISSPNILQETTPYSSNIVSGTFTSIPGTDYITGICTTKMKFLDECIEYFNKKKLLNSLKEIYQYQDIVKIFDVSQGIYETDEQYRNRIMDKFKKDEV